MTVHGGWCTECGAFFTTPDHTITLCYTHRLPRVVKAPADDNPFPHIDSANPEVQMMLARNIRLVACLLILAFGAVFTTLAQLP